MDSTRRTLLQAIPLIAASRALAFDNAVIPSFVKPYSDLPIKPNGQNESRAILDGALHTGEHEELFLLMKGNVAVTIEGKTTLIGPGSAAFIHSNEMHGVHNPGPEKAQYFVVATGT
jgi:mannose-6-phosphate isomerase-like protein (cupin superfamily)